MNNLEKIDELIKQLKTVRKELIKKDKLSTKLSSTDYRTVTSKRIDKMNTDLNWQCMHLDQSKVAFARLFKDSFLDISTEERTYNPSAFHEYKF